MNSEIETKTPSCFLCSSQKDYCFNSAADEFGLIEVRNKKQIVQWLTSISFLEGTAKKLKEHSKIYFCEVHYAKEEICRVNFKDGKTRIELYRNKAVPTYVKLEDRARNNRINSFLCLIDDYEKCLNICENWIPKKLDKKFQLLHSLKEIKIEIADNLVLKMWKNDCEIDNKFAIDAGYIEMNQRLLFWSRLRGLMRYFENQIKTEACTKFNTTPKKIDLSNMKTIKVTPEFLKTLKRVEMKPKTPLKLIPLQKMKTTIIEKASNGEQEKPNLTLTEKKTLKIPSVDPTAVQKPQELNVKIEKEDSTANSPHTEDQSDIDSANPNLPSSMNVNVSDESLEYYSFNMLANYLRRIGDMKLNWHTVLSYQNICILQIVITNHRPCILKALKADKNLYVSGYIKGTKVINNLINKTPGKLNKFDFYCFLNSLDQVPVKIKQDPEIVEVKQEKLDPSAFFQGLIPDFASLLENLKAFHQNDWTPICLDEKIVVIFKVDLHDIPKIKRCITIDRNLKVTIFGANMNEIPILNLITPWYELNPLTVAKIHQILAKLDETVFERMLRPTQFKLKTSIREGQYKTLIKSEHRVTSGRVKKHKCTMCDYESNTLNYVKQHYEIKHTPPDRQCPECGKQMNATQLKIHARFHIKKVHCYICNKGFADSRDLRKHVGIHNRQNFENSNYKTRPLSLRNQPNSMKNTMNCFSIKENELNGPRNCDEDEFMGEMPLLVKMEEIASVTHPGDDLLDVDQIKKEIEDQDDEMAEIGSIEDFHENNNEKEAVVID
uniref:CSON014771 protein n=1 Tax=Culicoides sonorensis TaxID=179676 RepID=A0A336LST1_CULSO